MPIQSVRATQAAADLDHHFATNGYGHAAVVADLVLERMPNGELAWLRPVTEPAESDDALYVPTQRGRDQVAHWRAERALFGAEVS
jgi:hypothetical protein